MDYQAKKGQIAKWYNGIQTIPPGWQLFNDSPVNPLPLPPTNFCNTTTKIKQTVKYIFIIKL